MPIPITLLVVPYSNDFKWQFDLLEYAVKKHNITDDIYISMVQRNRIYEKPSFECKWKTSLKYKMTIPFYEYDTSLCAQNIIYYPLNIQTGLSQIIDDLNDNDLIEIIECDMFHLSPKEDIDIEHGTLICDDVYENWHLKSKTDNADIIDAVYNTKTKKYNGGFFPVVTHAKTLKRILPDWIRYHAEILQLNISDNQKWWAGMYSLQIACQKNDIKMENDNCVYIPPINNIDKKRMAHYSVDNIFNKRMFPNIDFSAFIDNKYYSIIGEWYVSSKI